MLEKLWQEPYQKPRSKIIDSIQQALQNQRLNYLEPCPNDHCDWHDNCDCNEP